MHQYSKIIQNPSYGELQKAANQGRRCTWEKLSAIKANCGIELVLDECVAVLNHMRRLKRSATRAAASSHGLTTTVKFNASRRIPSWNCIARENSTGSLEEYPLSDGTSSSHQGVTGSTSKNRKTHRGLHDGSDSESENVDMNSWTRSGGPLMRTSSANLFTEFVQNLDVEAEVNRGLAGHPSPRAVQYNHSSRVTTPDRSSESSEFDQREFGNRVATNGPSLMVIEGDLLQPERIHNGIVFNVVKKEDLTPRSHDFENDNNEVAESVQIDCPEREMDAASSASEYGDDDSTAAKCPTESPDSNSADHHATYVQNDQSITDG